MIDAGYSAFQNITSLALLGPMLLGIAAGLIVGLLPGLGGTVGMTIALPFLFGMDPFAGMAMLVGLSAVNETSCTFPSVLIGVPGSGGSQATVLDGYAMAKQGKGAEALGASFSASMLGGVFGAASLLVVVVAARSLVAAIGSPELLMLTLLGIVVVGVLVRGDALLGMVSAVLGVMLGLMGAAPATPTYRFSFNQDYLLDGLPLAVVALGVFALPEVLSLLTNRVRISETAELQGGVWDGFRQTWQHKALVWRSSFVGTVVGAVPGLGGNVVDWIAYAVARQTVRDNSQFGYGDIRGVIAPEAANNAKEGGALIPTLMLGLPGSPSMALLLAGLILMGLAPGPQMVTQHLDITLTIVGTLVLANVVATGICLVLSRPIARITLIPGQILAPFLIVLFFAAAYQASHHVGDLILLVITGLAFYAMRIVGWPRVPALIGFVLSVSLERYLLLSMSRWGTTWLTKPSVVLLGLLCLSLVVAEPVVRRLRTRAENLADHQGPTP